MTSKKQTEQNSEELTTAHNDHNKALNNYAFYKVHDSVVSEDLVQDTFVKTWSYLVKGGKITMMRAFLYHVLNNLIVDEYRKRNHKAESLDTLIEGGFEPKDEENDRLVNILDGKVAVSRIMRLPLIYKRVMHMHFRDSLTLKEIARITGQTKNAIAVKIHRGIEKLKVLYKGKEVSGDKKFNNK